MRNKLIIGAFIFIIAASVVLLLLPADKAGIEAENRAISTVPEISRENVFSGEFASGFESFLGDTVGFRSFFTNLSKRTDDIKGITPETGSVIYTTKDIGTGTTLKLTLLLAGDTVMEMFTKNTETEKLYTDAVNSYAEKLPEDVKLFNMLIPTQLEFAEPIYKNLQDSQAAAIEDIYKMLDKSVTRVNVCETLAEHSGEYIYFRTDHHWTTLGAYYAYREFMNVEGGTAVNKNSFDKNAIENVLGYLYDKAYRAEMAQNPDSIEWYDVDPDKHITVRMHDVDEDGGLTNYKGVMYDKDKSDYKFFFGSDHPVVEMKNSENPEGKTIVVIKDSYANVFAPWLIKSYKSVILVDPRIYKGGFDAILDAFEPDEVLIMNYIFTTNFADYCNMLKNLYK